MISTHSTASLQRLRALHNERPGYIMKQSESEAPAQELSAMWSTPLLPLLPGPLWPGVIAPDRVLPVGQVELFDI